MNTHRAIKVHILPNPLFVEIYHDFVCLSSGNLTAVLQHREHKVLQRVVEFVVLVFAVDVPKEVHSVNCTLTGSEITLYLTLSVCRAVSLISYLVL